MYEVQYLAVSSYSSVKLSKVAEQWLCRLCSMGSGHLQLHGVMGVLLTSYVRSIAPAWTSSLCLTQSSIHLVLDNISAVCWTQNKQLFLSSVEGLAPAAPATFSSLYESCVT